MQGFRAPGSSILIRTDTIVHSLQTAHVSYQYQFERINIVKKVLCSNNIFMFN